MAKIEEIFHRYREESIQNTLEAQLIGECPKVEEWPMVLDDLVKIENDEMLFNFEGQPVRLRCVANSIPLTKSLTIEGNEKYYLFWIEKENRPKIGEETKIHYLNSGTKKVFDEDHPLDIAYGDDITAFVLTKRSTSSREIPEILHNWYTFDAGKTSYLFIETYLSYESSDRAFRIRGLNGCIEINIEKGEKGYVWVAHTPKKKQFPRNYEDFYSLIPIKCYELNFVDKSRARETLEEFKQEYKNGNAIIKLWAKYSEIEKERAEKFKDEIGEIRFDHVKCKKNGITTIELKPNEEQRGIIKDKKNEILKSSFIVVGKDIKLSFESIDDTCRATIDNNEYPLKDGYSGSLCVDIQGDETVKKRRDRALQKFLLTQSFILTNLTMAIAGKANEMLPRPSQKKYKPLSERTRKFMKEKFGIDELTPHQKEAVEMAINTPDIAVIQGPPGTGKTTVVAIICQRLMEITEKEKKKGTDGDNSKAILVSAFQNDTVQHTANKIYTNGLPTIIMGKASIQGITSQELFIKKIKNSIDDALQTLAPKNPVRSISSKLDVLKTLLEKERNEKKVREEISQMLPNISGNLLDEWYYLSHSSTVEIKEKEKLIVAVRGLRTDAESYSDDGYKMIRKLLRSGIPLSEEEKTFLEEAPLDNKELTDNFLLRLRNLQEKYLGYLLAEDNNIKGEIGINQRLLDWIDEAISEFKKKEEDSYEDRDTFLTATLQSLREDLFNTHIIKETLLHYTQSVATTNQYAGSHKVVGTEFENVILEEAARSNPLDLLIPMVKATRRIIMIGDHRQLPHLLEKDIVDESVKGTKDGIEIREKYKDSLFEIIFENLKTANPIRRITLTDQFRMHPVIGDFISNTYYGGTLNSKLVNVGSKLHDLQIPWAKNKVAIFCDVPITCGKEERIGSSIVRKVEAQKTVKILNELWKDEAFERLNVCIITFYSGQVDEINAEAEKYGYTEREKGEYQISQQYRRTNDGKEKLRIGSVDSFQGKEFDIVILSTVRSNNIPQNETNQHKIFGFLTLENRLNVALSRAQKLIIVVGDRAMFAGPYAENYVKGLYEFNKLTEGEYGNRIQASDL